MATGREQISTLPFKVLWANLEYICESSISSSEYYVQMQQVYKITKKDKAIPVTGHGGP
jgi:hypothetical protein